MRPGLQLIHKPETQVFRVRIGQTEIVLHVSAITVCGCKSGLDYRSSRASLGVRRPGVSYGHAELP